MSCLRIFSSLAPSGPPLPSPAVRVHHLGVVGALGGALPRCRRTNAFCNSSPHEYEDQGDVMCTRYAIAVWDRAGKPSRHEHGDRTGSLSHHEGVATHDDAPCTLKPRSLECGGAHPLVAPPAPDTRLRARPGAAPCTRCWSACRRCCYAARTVAQAPVCSYHVGLKCPLVDRLLLYPFIKFYIL
jgi:hypothetical protein